MFQRLEHLICSHLHTFASETLIEHYNIKLFSNVIQGAANKQLYRNFIIWDTKHSIGLKHNFLVVHLLDSCCPLCWHVCHYMSVVHL